MNASVARILEEGELCHVAAMTPLGPHVTPMVFATAGDRIWVTTSRGSVKATAWRADPRVGGLVRAGERAVLFAGSVLTHDLLDPGSWIPSIRAGPLLVLASARFSRKNARFFAGYAVDAHHLPFAWTPPGRVFSELRIDRSVVLGDGRAAPTGGGWGDELRSQTRFRATRTGEGPLTGLPAEVAERLGTSGEGTLGVSTPSGPVVLPTRWLAHGGAVYAALPQDVLALAGGGPVVPVALQTDRVSWWRARAMVGAMMRGLGEIAVVRELDSGARSAAALASHAGVEPEGAALVRIRPERLVWWRGWSSGTVTLA